MVQYFGRIEWVCKRMIPPTRARLYKRGRCKRSEARYHRNRRQAVPRGRKQYRVAEGDVIFVEKLNVEAGEAVKFDRVLAVIGEEGSVFGKPVIEGATVSASVVKNGKSKKVRVFKMKPKKGYRRTQGHRQPYTKVQIEAINA